MNTDYLQQPTVDFNAPVATTTHSKEQVAMEKAVNKAMNAIRSMTRQASKMSDDEKEKMVKALQKEVADFKKKIFEVEEAPEEFKF